MVLEHFRSLLSLKERKLRFFFFFFSPVELNTLCPDVCDHGTPPGFDAGSTLLGRTGIIYGDIILALARVEINSSPSLTLRQTYFHLDW